MKKKEETPTTSPTTETPKTHRVRRTPEQILQAALDNVKGLRGKLEHAVTDAEAGVYLAAETHKAALARLEAFDLARKG